MVNLKTRDLVEISMLVALALVLDFIAGIYSQWFWLQGGSVSISLAPLAILSYKQGVKIGIFGGMLMGILQLLTGAYIFHPVQLLLDYPLAFGALGLTGIWTKAVKNKENVTLVIIISTLLASTMRFLSHTVSGYVFFRQWFPDDINPWLHSAIYNVGYVFMSWLASAVILILIYKYHPKLVRK